MNNTEPIYCTLATGWVAETKEIIPGVLFVDYDDSGTPLGIEILAGEPADLARIKAAGEKLAEAVELVIKTDEAAEAELQSRWPEYQPEPTVTNQCRTAIAEWKEANHE